MPGIDLKYGVVLVDGKQFHDDEPVFVIRAQDVSSVDGILDYGRRAKAAGATDAFVAVVREAATRFLHWQQLHPHLVKTPD